MTSVQTTRVVGYPWADLFDLVLDVQSYPKFVPHCRSVTLLSRKTPEPGVTIIVSQMTVGLSAFEVGYVNRTTGDRSAHQINVDALDGPLRHLRTVWSFEALKDDCTRLHFLVDYEFSNFLLATVASQLFTTMFSDILSAFERRAAHLTGHSGVTVPR